MDVWNRICRKASSPILASQHSLKPYMSCREGTTDLARSSFHGLERKIAIGPLEGIPPIPGLVTLTGRSEESYYPHQSTASRDHRGDCGLLTLSPDTKTSLIPSLFDRLATSEMIRSTTSCCDPLVPEEGQDIGASGPRAHTVSSTRRLYSSLSVGKMSAADEDEDLGKERR